MGWATAHFQSGVATLKWCHDMRGRGVHGMRSCMHDQGPTSMRTGVCLGRPVVTGLFRCFVTIEILASR